MGGSGWLFENSRELAKSVYRQQRPESLEDYRRRLYHDLLQAAWKSGWMGREGDEYRVARQADSSARWWWDFFQRKEKERQRESIYRSYHPNARKPTWTKGEALGLMRMAYAFGALVMDSETTGVGPDARIIEFSLLDMKGTVLFSSLIDPGIPIPQGASEKNGICDPMIQGSPSFADVADRITHLVDGRTLLGWNVSFDDRMLKSEMKACGRKALWNTIDVMDVCASYLGRRNMYLKMQKAKELFGLGDSQEHRSLADCLDMLAIIDRIRRDDGIPASQLELF